MKEVKIKGRQRTSNNGYKLNHRINKGLYNELYEYSKKENDSFYNILSLYFFKKPFEELEENEKDDILLIES